MDFKLKSPFSPTGDQPQAIEKLIDGLKAQKQAQVLLGVTGSGKTFTIANVVQRLNIPTLVISHNKTLAGQLYQEFRDFFPQNAVSYFVSYYDFYQPEAYVPQSNTYIEKEADVNQLIDKLRLEATSNILSRKDVLVVSSVSCIYNIGKAENYKNNVINLRVGQKQELKDLKMQLVDLQYSHNQYEFSRGTFRDRGEYLDVHLSYNDMALRVNLEGGEIRRMQLIDPLTGEKKAEVREYGIFPSKHYLVGGENEAVLKRIKADLDVEVAAFEAQKKFVEAQRLKQRVEHDLEMLKEVGYVSGIENYSRYFDGRETGDSPYSLVDYFNYAYGNDWLLIIDESHMTVPQIGGMYAGDFSRKSNLVNYGFRLKASFDNRPLKFDEFMEKTKRTIYVSATPAVWELERSENTVEQLIRPTGIPDPTIKIYPSEKQIPRLIKEIEKRTIKGERVLVTTLTKKTAEDLAAYLKDKKIKAQYLHSDIKTLERSDVLDSLRKGEYDVLIGINLLREGLDLPEVTLVAILDADKEGFLRSKTALVQTMGRAARNAGGEVLIFTDKMTNSVNGAIAEVQRRREYQLAYNAKHDIKPVTIIKPIRERVIVQEQDDLKTFFSTDKHLKAISGNIDEINKESLTPYDRKKLVKKLRLRMKKEADNLNFEMALAIREKVKELES